MRYALLVLRITFGLLFIASAVLKLIPIDAFEMVLIRQAGISWSLAPLFARLLVLFEFAVGTAIVFNFQLKKALWLSLAMLLVFTVYLVHVVATGRGAEDCGCFGELLPMDAPTSIMKNIMLGVMGATLFMKSREIARWRFSWIALVLIVVSVPALFLRLPLPEAALEVPPTLDYTAIQTTNEAYDWDLNRGEKLLVVMYANCIHCVQLGTLLSTADAEAVQDRLRIVVFGKEERVAEFIEETGLHKFAYHRADDRTLLVAIDGTFPAVIRISDGQVKSNWKGAGVNIDMLQKMLFETTANP